MRLYKTTPYSGTTTSSDVNMATATLPKGTYLVFSSGYSSLYGGYIRGVNYVDSMSVLEVATPTTYTICAASSSSESWVRYVVNFLKIK